jgi:hypothetical protein
MFAEHLDLIVSYVEGASVHIVIRRISGYCDYLIKGGASCNNESLLL